MSNIEHEIYINSYTSFAYYLFLVDFKEVFQNICNIMLILSIKLIFKSYLHHYFNGHVCLSIRCPSDVRPSGVRHKNFFSRKMPWNHPLTPGDHHPSPRVDPQHNTWGA